MRIIWNLCVFLIRAERRAQRLAYRLRRRWWWFWFGWRQLFSLWGAPDFVDGSPISLKTAWAVARIMWK